MRSVIAPYLILLNVFIFMTLGDLFEYGNYGDADLEGGSIVGDSFDLFASDDASELNPMDLSEYDDNTQYFISSGIDCTSDLGGVSQFGKVRRGDVCHGNEDGDYRMNEQPFILPSTLLDAVTIEPQNYCPSQKFDEGSQYLVCSSGFSMDMLSYGVAYQALLNGELGRYLFAFTAPVLVV